jgi:hypothetical protein
MSSNSLRGHNFYTRLERYRLEDLGGWLYVEKSGTVVAWVIQAVESPTERWFDNFGFERHISHS